MARSRLLANKILTSEKLNAIDEGSENLFYHLLVLVDDFGRYYANPKIVKSYCYPLRELSLEIIIDRLENLESIGLIQLYKNNGEAYLEIVEFEKYQKFRSDIKRKEDFPIPTEVCNESDTSRIESDTACDVEKSTVNRNRSNNEGKNENEYPLEFRLFWNQYPKQKGKTVAFNAWKEHPKKNYKELILAAKNYRNECINLKTDLKYIKEPSGFIRLAKEYWKDYLGEVVLAEVGKSRLPKDTPKEKEKKDDYLEARMKKQIELRKKYNYSTIKTAEDLEKADHIIQNELATWTKEYYGHKVET